MGITFEQGRVVQRRRVTGVVTGLSMAVAMGGNDGTDFNHAAQTAPGINAAMEAVQQGTATVSHLFQVIQLHGFLVVNPLQGHAGHISPEDLMVQMLSLPFHPKIPELLEKKYYVSID
jgi:hypothetical protein